MRRARFLTRIPEKMGKWLPGKLPAVWSSLSQRRSFRALVVAVSLLSLSLPVIHPLMFGSLPSADGSLLHLYRLMGLDHAMQYGTLWPRYVPGLAFGYGLPLFNFVSPVPYYLPEALHLLGVDFVRALIVSVAVYILLGGIGAYLFGASWGGPVVGIGTAAAVIYAPYTLLTLSARMAVPEMMGMAFLAWCLWSYRQVAFKGRRRDYLVSAGFFAGMALSHHVTAIFGSVLLALYCVMLWWSSPDPRRAFWRLGISMMAPVSVLTFYWLPAGIESRFLRGDSSLAAQDFQSLKELFALPRTADLTRLSPVEAYPLSLIQIILGLLGVLVLVWLIRREKELPLPQRLWAVFSALLIVVFGLASTPVLGGMWQYLPLSLSPWQMVGFASLLLAGLAGVGFAALRALLDSRGWRAGWVSAALLGGMLYGLPWLYTAYLPDPPTESIIDAQNFERAQHDDAQKDWMAYLPVWTEQIPESERLIGLFAESELIPRLQPDPAIEITEQAWGATEAALTLEARQDTAIVFYWLYFPGWEGVVDGEPVRVRPIRPHGFASIPLEAGTHTVEIAYNRTPTQMVAVIISLVAMIGMIGGMFLNIWGVSEREKPVDFARYGGLFGVVIVMGVLMLGIKALLLDNIESPFKRTRFAEGVEAGLDQPVGAVFGEQVELAGYDLAQDTVRPGQVVPLKLYWVVPGNMLTQDYASLYVIRDEEGNVIQHAIASHPGGVPTSTWVPGFYVMEAPELEIPLATPPGMYTVSVALYADEVANSLLVSGADGDAPGTLLDLVSVTVSRPRSPARTSRIPPDERSDERLSETISLVGYNALPRQATVGQPLQVAWLWKAEHQPEQDWQAQLLWLDENGDIQAESRSVPLTASYPTGEWHKRDVWRGLHTLYVPGGLDSGMYTVALRLVGEDGDPAEEMAILGEMTVTAPERTDSVPEMQREDGSTWVNGIRLAGYDLSTLNTQQGGGVYLTLYWQTDVEITEGLIIFVHLIDESGQIAFEREQVPAFGARPATGWAPGEIVADGYGLLIPQEGLTGEYRIRLGIRSEHTGEAIPLTDGSEFRQLPDLLTVTVSP